MSGDTRKKRHFFNKSMLILNILTLIGLLLVYASSVISPKSFWPLAFVAMSYPLLLIITCLLFLFWLAKRKWLLFLNLAFLLIRWDLVAATIQFNPTLESPENGMKVMSYNVRLFDYYNWSKNKNTRHWIYDFLINQNPNILCFQEFYHDNTGYFPTIDTLLEVNSLKHMHVENYNDKVDSKQLWGMATLSSYPIISKGRIEFQGTFGNMCLFTDLKIADDTVRVYNLHLQSFRLGNKDYALMDDMVKNKELTDIQGGKSIVKQIVNGFQKRGLQAEQVRSHIEQCPYPVIICGDFNDVPSSYAYQTISSGLKDSFSESGNGLGSTFVKFPLFRIDNILYSPKFRSKTHTVHPYELSDHYAVSATIQKR
jgi:endonuclease/exonuclease/phosphatase family metal-dependent hydrolase